MSLSPTERRTSLAEHGRKLNRPVQHLLDLDAEFPTLQAFGPQCIGFEVGPGWVSLLRKLFPVLVANGCLLGQVKQKFGGLRVYVDLHEDGDSAAVAAAIRIAEEKSWATCEICGASIDPPRQPSHATRCDECRAKDARGVRGMP